MSEQNQQQVNKIWIEAAEKVKDRVIAPTLYRALELGVGIVIDGEHFVVGFASADMPMASHLRSAQHRAIIDQTLSSVVGSKVRLLIIDGTQPKDYEKYKTQLAARESAASTVSVRRDEERRVQLAWDEVGEQITRSYARLNLRQLPQTRAAFLLDAFGVINETVNRLGYSDDSDELQKRSLARVFEKFATVVDVPSALLAYEFARLRAEGKLK